MIYVTGDTHGTHDFAKLLDNKYKKLTKGCIAISAILWHNIFNFIIEIVNKMTISYKEEWKYE